MSERRLLVLGSSGQIGTALTEFLRGLGSVVDTYDIAASSDEDLRKWPNEELSELIKNSSYVFFLAFDVGGSHYLEKYQDTLEFVENNLRIMANTFNLLKKHETPHLFASSQMASMSYSTYGLLKLLGERMTRSIGGRVVHFWNVYGYESDRSKFHAISDFIDMGIEKGRIEMRTSGEESRDFLYVDDCCKALETVMRLHHSLPEHMKIHVASGEFVKVRSVAEIVASQTKSEVIPGIKTDLVQRDAKHLPDLSFQEFWKPSIPIEHGIQLIIDKVRESNGYFRS